ncbi:MAG: hypothetical protein AABY40_01195, partial [Nanoarchaeota archaeon]
TFVDEESFKMNEDQKADFIDAKEEKPGLFVKEIEGDLSDMGHPTRRAADSCPAGVIRIIDLETGRRIAGHPIESELQDRNWKDVAQIKEKKD